ncbi:TRAP transporter large permease [Chloroflexota bacterium]
MVEPNWVWAMIQVVVLTGLCLSGLHVFVAIGATAVIFSILFIGDISQMTALMGGIIWNRSIEYGLTMLPLFILMGAWVDASGVGKDAYDAAVRWLVRLKGSLAIVSMIALALFGAVSGSTAAGIATIGSLGLPEMRRYGYAAELRTGCLAAGGMLVALIPPSTIMILYSVLTDESVGKMLIAGIIPGLILLGLLCIVIYIWVTLRPQDAPKLPSEVRFTWLEKFASLRLIGPIAVIFLILIGGIFMGWFSPTEAAAVGAFTVLVICLAYRRMNWQSFKGGLIGAARTTAMILIMITGAFIIASNFAMTQVSPILSAWVERAGLGYVALAYAYIVVQILVGIPLDALPMLVIFMPIFYPAFKAMPNAPEMVGIWFGIMNVILVCLAGLTPPIAAPLYLTQMIDGCPTSKVMIGVIPFYLCSVSLMVLLVHLPFLATWLPSLMIGGG